MNFERGKDTKEALQIGKAWDAKKVECIYVSVRDPSIEDTRDRSLVHRGIFQKNPQTKDKRRIQGEDLHRVLTYLSQGIFPWDIFFKEVFPDYEEDIKSKKFTFSFFIILEEKRDGWSGRPAISHRDARGKTLYYDKKIYFIPKSGKI
jgi:hypothetical protein